MTIKLIAILAVMLVVLFSSLYLKRIENDVNDIEYNEQLRISILKKINLLMGFYAGVNICIFVILMLL